MKYINMKTLSLMLTASVVLGLTGCNQKPGEPSERQLVGGSPGEVAPGNSAPVANAGEAQLVIVKNFQDAYFGESSAKKSAGMEQKGNEKVALPEEQSDEPQK